jgi:hypothetical protein
MLTPSTFQITDDSGFLAIINVDKYNSYVSEEWGFPQLIKHFCDEMNKEYLVIWATGLEYEWTVEVSKGSTNKMAFREFSKSIEVTNGKLYLTNYEDLTMAAQFEKVKLPIRHNAGLFVNLDNGRYELTIRKLFDLENFDFDKEGDVNFEILIKPYAGELIHQADEIFWWDNHGGI